jgi:hypothetical protein
MNYPVNQNNQLQYSLQQPAQRVMYPYALNPNIAQAQPQFTQIQSLQNGYYSNQLSQINQNAITNISNVNNTATKNTSNQDILISNGESNNQNNPETPMPTMSLLTKYKEIYVPTIYLLDYSDTTKSPFNILAANSTQSPAQYNQLTGQVINNNQTQVNT